MSDDQTRDPSPRRRQEARQRGFVAHSPELTAAVGLLAALGALFCVGDDLVASLVEETRRSWLELDRLATVAADPAAWVLTRAQSLTRAILWPLGLVLIAAAAAATLAHQIQVGGLWAPGLIVPRGSRLWPWGAESPREGESMIVDRVGRPLWIGIKSLLILGTALLWLRVRGVEALGRGEAGVPERVHGMGRSLLLFCVVLSVVWGMVGLMDWALRRRRWEQRLRQTPEEQRQDQKAVEGDPAQRGRRRRLALARTGRFDLPGRPPIASIKSIDAAERSTHAQRIEP